MATFDVLLFVDGNVVVSVEAADEDEAATKALAAVAEGDYAYVEVAHRTVDEMESDAD